MVKNPLLQKLCLPAFVDYQSDFFLPDDPSDCGFSPSYPYPVSYNFNSRGYRDHEWPDDLDNVIWCVGDSATLGIGVPFDHTWSSVLNRKTGIRCINISLRGASNQWIARQTQQLLDSEMAEIIVVQWSYLHRRERSLESALDRLFLPFYSRIKHRDWPNIKCFNDFHSLSECLQQEILESHSYLDIGDKKVSLWDIVKEEKFNWLDEERSLHHGYTSTVDDINFTLALIDIIETFKKHRQVIHSFIPDFLDSDSITKFETRFQERYACRPIRATQVDFARDSSHYDIITASAYANDIMHRL